MAEKSLRQALQLSDVTAFFTRPICLFFILLSIASVVFSLKRNQTAKDLVEG